MYIFDGPHGNYFKRNNYGQEWVDIIDGPHGTSKYVIIWKRPNLDLVLFVG